MRRGVAGLKNRCTATAFAGRFLLFSGPGGEAAPGSQE